MQSFIQHTVSPYLHNSHIELFWSVIFSYEKITYVHLVQVKEKI